MATANPPKSRPLLLGRCANCILFDWDQPEPAPLKQCSRCKVLQYCGDSCQREHWKVVHKKHCWKLATAKDGEGVHLVGIFSHHPFDDAKLPSDPFEALLMLVQKVLLKIESSKQPAFTKVKIQLVQLGEGVKKGLEEIWAKITGQLFRSTG